MKELSKTFCVYPWVHQMVETNGDVKLCCIAESPTLKASGQHMNINKHKLSELWNDPYMQSVRQRMLEGKQVKDCGQCMRKEREGEKSMRQIINPGWQVDNADLFVKTLPKYLDLRFGNLCNLRCRMCTGMYSSELGQELESIRQTNKDFQKMYPDSLEYPVYDWSNDQTFWSDLEKYIPYIEIIYLTGGEPTLVQGNYDFLQKLIDVGVSKNIVITFNTNVTNFQQRFLDIIGHFAKVRLALSIDGTGGVQEYIRFPSKWKAIQNNIHKLLEHVKDANNKFELSFAPAISILNVANFNDYINWSYNIANQHQYDNLVWDMDPSRVHGPEFQDIWHATKEYRQISLTKLKSVQTQSIQFFPSLQNFYNEIITCLESNYHDHAEANRKSLKIWNDSIDKKRRIDIKDYIPYSEAIYG